MSAGAKLKREVVLPIAQRLAALLAPTCEWLQIAGSLRRNKPEISDIEIVATSQFHEGCAYLWWALDHLLTEGVIRKAHKSNGAILSWGDKYRAFWYMDVRVDVFTCDAHNRGYVYLLRTGSGDANQYLVTRIKYHAPFRLQDGRVWVGDKPLSVPDETAFYALCGMPFIPPAERTPETYKYHLEAPTHKWGDVTPLPTPETTPPARQLMLPGSGFDRHETLLEKDRAAPNSKAAQRYEWLPPWKFDNTYVFVPAGWMHGQRHFRLFKIDSEIAEKQRQHLERAWAALSYSRETDELKRVLWAIEDERDMQMGWVTHSHPYRDMAAWSDVMMYPYSDTSLKLEWVNLSDVVLNQARYFMPTLRHFLRQPNSLRFPLYRDDKPYYPRGTRFVDSDTIYLTHGFHRVLAARMWQHAMLQIEVDSVPLTLAEARNDVRLVMAEAI